MAHQGSNSGTVLLRVLGVQGGVLLVGYTVGVLRPDLEVSSLSHFVSFVALPSMLFRSMATIDVASIDLHFLLAMLLSKWAVAAGGALLASRMLTGSRLKSAGLGGLIATCSNDLAFGMPLVAALFPALDGQVVLLSALQNLLVNPVMFMVMDLDKAIRPGAPQGRGPDRVPGRVPASASTSCLPPPSSEGNSSRPSLGSGGTLAAGASTSLLRNGALDVTGAHDEDLRGASDSRALGSHGCSVPWPSSGRSAMLPDAGEGVVPAGHTLDVNPTTDSLLLDVEAALAAARENGRVRRCRPPPAVAALLTTLQNLATNLATVAVVTGLVFNLASSRRDARPCLPAVLDDVLQTLSGAFPGTAIFTLGLTLAKPAAGPRGGEMLNPGQQEMEWLAVAALVALKLVVAPVVCHSLAQSLVPSPPCSSAADAHAGGGGGLSDGGSSGLSGEDHAPPSAVPAIWANLAWVYGSLPTAPWISAFATAYAHHPATTSRAITSSLAASFPVILGSSLLLMNVDTEAIGMVGTVFSDACLGLSLCATAVLCVPGFARLGVRLACPAVRGRISMRARLPHATATARLAAAVVEFGRGLPTPVQRLAVAQLLFSAASLLCRHASSSPGLFRLFYFCSNCSRLATTLLCLRLASTMRAPGARKGFPGAAAAGLGAVGLRRARHEFPGPARRFTHSSDRLEPLLATFWSGGSSGQSTAGDHAQAGESPLRFMRRTLSAPVVVEAHMDLKAVIRRLVLGTVPEDGDDPAPPWAQFGARLLPITVCLGGTVPFLFQPNVVHEPGGIGYSIWVVGGVPQIVWDVCFNLLAMVALAVVVGELLERTAAPLASTAVTAGAGASTGGGGGASLAVPDALPPANPSAASILRRNGRRVSTVPELVVMMALGARLLFELALLLSQLGDGWQDRRLHIAGNAQVMVWLLCSALTHGQGLITALVFASRAVPEPSRRTGKFPRRRGSETFAYIHH